MAHSKSKKQSDASSPATPHDDATFFLDRCLGYKKLPKALQAAGVNVVPHDDHFATNAKDADWLPVVGKAGWIVLTKDDRIRHHPLEMAALKCAGIGAFIFARGDLSATEYASIFIKALPSIRKFLRKTQRPFIARITRSGSISPLDNPDD